MILIILYMSVLSNTEPCYIQGIDGTGHNFYQ